MASFRLALAIILLATPTATAALVVQGYDPLLHDRFENDPSFIGNPYDWSGVGRTTAATARWGTLISPSFILSANHYPASGTLRFYESNDPNGAFEERTIVQSIILYQDGQIGTPLRSDLRLSRLSAPITNAAYYPILDLPQPSDFLGETIYTFGRDATTGVTSQRLGRNQIDAILPELELTVNGIDYRNDVMIFDYDNPGGVGADESFVQSGDSGAPSFVIVNGQPALVGLHWFNYTTDDFGGLLGTGSGDTFVSSFVDEINAAMAGTGSLERVTVLTAVPEPAGMWVVLAGSVTLLSRARRRTLVI